MTDPYSPLSQVLTHQILLGCSDAFNISQSFRLSFYGAEPLDLSSTKWTGPFLFRS